MAEEIQEAVQIIRVAYDGIEIAMKVGSGGIAAMQKAIDFLKGMLDYEKSLGKTSMRKLLLKGGDLQVLQKGLPLRCCCSFSHFSQSEVSAPHFRYHQLPESDNRPESRLPQPAYSAELQLYQPSFFLPVVRTGFPAALPYFLPLSYSLWQHL